MTEPPQDLRTTFKLAFLRTCADQGLDAAAAAGRAERAAGALEKQAIWPQLLSALTSVGKGVFVDAPSRVVTALAPYAAGAAVLGGIGIPLAGGVLAGHALQKATGSDADIDEARANELIAEYDRQTAQAKRYAALRQYRDRILPAAGRSHLP